MTRLSEDQITALFREPRTMRKFTDRPVTDDQLREIQELTYLGPTAFNSQPLRITWIKSPEARERLVKHLIEANQEKARQAPVNAILSYDKAWIDRADVFNPRAAETIRNYCTTEEIVTFAAQQSANLQAGYFITVVRALGLDAGPITGVDFEALAADPVLLGGADQQPFLVVNLGYGLGPYRARGLRFDFEDVTRTV